MSPDWTINSITLKTVCKNQFVVDGSMAVVQSCYVSSGLESWFEIIHVKPPNMKSQSWSFSLSELWKKNISHPTILVGQQLCSSIYEQSSLDQSRISINVQTFFSKPIFSHKKKKDHVRQKVHQSSPRSSFHPPLKKRLPQKIIFPFYQQNKKFKPKNPQATQPPYLFFGGGSIPLV